MSLPKITVQSLSEMQSIASGHPVYRVKIQGSNYVLKAETASGNTGSSDIKWASKIMKNVGDKNTGDSQIRLLEENEIDVIATRYGNFNLTGPQTINLEDTLTMADNVWYLMAWQPGLYNPSDNMNNGEIDQLFGIVNHGVFWKKLGKIIAVDLFTGNNDRFDFGNYEQATPQNFWSNRGNLFVNVNNLNNASPMGLDFYFNQNAFGKDLFGDQAYIKAMKSKNEIAVIANLIVESIMDALAGKNLGKKDTKREKFTSKLSTKLRGYNTTADKYKGYLKDAIWEGLEEIKRYLVNKRREYAQRAQAQQNMPQPQWQNNPLNQRQVPNVRNNIPQRPGATVPVAHNNLGVSKSLFPQNLEARMQALNWI